MARNLTEQVREIAEVTKSVARGDLTKTVNADVQGEILDLKITVNDMVAQLTVFAAEVTRVSLEVGTEGKLGGQALVPNVEGTWMVLTDNVNLMVSLDQRMQYISSWSGFEPYDSSPKFGRGVSLVTHQGHNS